MQATNVKLLLLGGTADARQLCQQLTALGFSVVYSVAGLVRRPKLEAEVLVGGFSQFGGLARYCTEQAITAIVDATHPYAQKMSDHAVQVSAQLSLPLWRFKRPNWPKLGNITGFQDWPSLIQALPKQGCVFLTAGQIPKDALANLQDQTPSQRQWLLRTAVAPSHDLLPNMSWIKAIGPFSVADEQSLFKQYSVKALVCKDSGGESTVAKLQVAQQLTLPVFMLLRPKLRALPIQALQFDQEQVMATIEHIQQYFKQR
jgi:precorrin-6A/cobalt-precorrin-6A reductase